MDFKTQMQAHSHTYAIIKENIPDITYLIQISKTFISKFHTDIHHGIGAVVFKSSLIISWVQANSPHSENTIIINLHFLWDILMQ